MSTEVHDMLIRLNKENNDLFNEIGRLKGELQELKQPLPPFEPNGEEIEALRSENAELKLQLEAQQDDNRQMRAIESIFAPIPVRREQITTKGGDRDFAPVLAKGGYGRVASFKDVKDHLSKDDNRKAYAGYCEDKQSSGSRIIGARADWAPERVQVGFDEQYGEEFER